MDATWLPVVIAASMLLGGLLAAWILAREARIYREGTQRHDTVTQEPSGFRVDGCDGFRLRDGSMLADRLRLIEGGANDDA